MTAPFPQLPLDDPNVRCFEQVHALDRDVPSTTMAIMLVHHAMDDGHPDDSEAAGKALTGPAAAAAIQATLKPYVETAIGHDKLAQMHTAEAVELARDSLDTARRRSSLPDDSVALSDGSAKTRRQVQQGHDHCLITAAQRETRGDFEHHARQPGPAIRLAAIPVLALIEVFLLIWPVTNATWSDPTSVGYAIGLVILFLLGNEFLPRWAGVTAREARDASQAAAELTQLSTTLGQQGDRSKGREAAGQVDEGHVAHTRRRMLGFRVGLWAVVAVYAAVMFTRVVRLASGLGWPLPFVLVAAGLITAFTAGAPLMLAWWWSRGNKLGDQIREYGAILDQSRLLASELDDQARDQARIAGVASADAQHELDLAEQVIHDGQHVVYVGMQKAAAILNQGSVLLPAPENLHVPGRAVRDATLESLHEATAIVAEAQHLLDADPMPFPDGLLPNPWGLRSEPRHALPNPAHVHGSQLGILHTPESAPVPWWRNPWLLAALTAAALTAAAILLLFA